MKKLVAVSVVLIMLVSTTLLTSCSKIGGSLNYATNVIDLQVESTLIKNQYSKVYDLIVTEEESFTEEEWAQLNDIHFAFTETASRISEMMKKPENVITPKELRQMYELAYIGYTNARDIISSHKDIFTSYQWAQMVDFNDKAIQYDIEVRAILDNPDTEDINKTLGLIITLGGVAYKFILPVLVSLI